MRRLRAEQGWTQEELAHRSGLDRSFLAHVERCARNVSLDVIERIATAFELPIADLFRDNRSSDDC
ncbi:helix-turn-helix domain-containing protein [Ralstonia wenshanensis]|uniref:helix-turn-helix domain-containing protein n=1 Tax=Ralstonia wenshanensis TaxID=2842456 RepID=UPI0021B385B3|nr:helix-turn-helix transcriptional regulator [Ralstonia wenshanensis]MCT7307140.1 helix-turn-helix transcriptional regulator [Ralstonia wenshanensis]